MVQGIPEPIYTTLTNQFVPPDDKSFKLLLHQLSKVIEALVSTFWVNQSHTKYLICCTMLLTFGIPPLKIVLFLVIHEIHITLTNIIYMPNFLPLLMLYVDRMMQKMLPSSTEFALLYTTSAAYMLPNLWGNTTVKK